ncbi:MAG: hypothetical protein ACKOXB_15795 [Flavobacteriales bacterium]
MTYRECLNQLWADATKKYEELAAAQDRLVEETNGFFPKEVLYDYEKAYLSWQAAQNNYNGVLAFVNNNRLDLNLNIG